ncbi:anti-sigma-D factor RsdA [Saccharopolyspora flava]|uniref:Anti-sigma-D factor RsdA to sigma factor binding region n=1 Tax=Saccharopolyspora flava TaxID=95161 RepID=A0A1I6PRT2_9PSEU|nr:anti-sigma-D factor RsdA [Saccharopolyspora flava]SFS42924.1 Anti-sigma-D factor RsdA to sigma factor binding region [Saccharopolyspora flava]
MAERKGPDGELGGIPHEESAPEQDRSTRADERDSAPAERSADEGTELSDNHRDSGSNEPETSRDEAGAEVLTFRPRGDADEELTDLDDFSDEPIDLAALQEDDLLLDALGGTNPDVPASADGSPSLEELLVAWRQDVDSAPIGDLVDTDTAAAAIAEAGRPRSFLRRRHLVPVATAAAVLMITFTGVGVAARDAQPGDMLWGVAQVLYTDHTRAVQAAASARTDLDTAESAVDRGNRLAAEEALRSAKEHMAKVDAENGLSELKAAHESLTKRIDRGSGNSSHTSTPTTTLPPTTQPSPSQPLPPNPGVPPTGSSTPPSSTSDPTSPTTSPSETSSSESSSGGWFWPNQPQTSTP